MSMKHQLEILHPMEVENAKSSMDVESPLQCNIFMRVYLHGIEIDKCKFFLDSGHIARSHLPHIFDT